MAKNINITSTENARKQGGYLGYNLTDSGKYNPVNGTVVRDTTATYIDEQGILQTEQANVARVDYTNGVAELLLEPSSTNLFTSSEDFSQGWVITNGAFGTSQRIQSPDGKMNGFNVIVNQGVIYFPINTNLVSGQEYTFSCYYKGNSNKTINMSHFNGTSFSGGTKTLSSEWDRFSINIIASASTNLVYITDSRNSIFTANDIYIWGAQIEQKGFATSYIPTNGATATRSAELVANFGSSQIINSFSGVLFFEGVFNSDTDGYLGLRGVSDLDTCQLYFKASANNNILTIVNNVTRGEYQTDTSVIRKYAIKYNPSDYEFYIDGVLIETNSKSLMSDMIVFSFTSGGSSNPFYGRVRQVKHLPYNTDISKL